MNIDTKILQNINKLNPTVYKRDTSQQSGVAPRNARCVQHLKSNQCNLPYQQSKEE